MNLAFFDDWVMRTIKEGRLGIPKLIYSSHHGFLIH